MSKFVFVLLFIVFAQSAMSLSEMELFAIGTSFSLAGAALSAADSYYSYQAKNDEDDDKAKQSLLAGAVMEGVSVIALTGAIISGIVGLKYQKGIEGAVGLSILSLLCGLGTFISSTYAFIIKDGVGDNLRNAFGISIGSFIADSVAFTAYAVWLWDASH